MPKGIVRTDLNQTGTTFKDGTPVTLPKEFGTEVELPLDLGNAVPAAASTDNNNPVDWEPAVDLFGNAISPPPN
jgi:hypothetical protein